MTTQPYVLGKEEGTAIWFLGTLTFVKAAGKDTGGAFGLIEQLIPGGFASPHHVHHAEDETFYILDGELAFICGNKRWKARSGDYLFLPRDIPHGFRVEGTAPARLLVLATPAGFEQFVLEASEPAKRLTLPPPATPDLDKLTAVAAKYKIDILGPLPD